MDCEQPADRLGDLVVNQHNRGPYASSRSPNPPWLSGTDGGYRPDMGFLLVVLILALIFGGLGFVAHVLWIVAIVLGIAWLVGFALRSGRNTRT